MQMNSSELLPVKRKEDVVQETIIEEVTEREERVIEAKERLIQLWTLLTNQVSHHYLETKVFRVFFFKKKKVETLFGEINELNYVTK